MQIDSNVKELQARELEILKALAQVFEKNGIDFWLAYGTVLGCVRHQGFIPWDDDIDIYVRGEDYPKIRKIFEEQDTGFLALHDHTTAEGYPYVFPKVIDKRTKLKEKAFTHLDYVGGVYVDIFLLFDLPNNKMLRAIKQKQRYFRYALVRGAYSNTDTMSGAKKAATRIIKAFVSPKRVQKRLYKGYLKPLSAKRRFVTEPNVFTEKCVSPKTYFSGAEQRTFEDVMMPIPLECEKYLTDMYGDYMRLPDEKDRVSCHDFAVLELND